MVTDVDADTDDTDTVHNAPAPQPLPRRSLFDEEYVQGQRVPSPKSTTAPNPLMTCPTDPTAHTAAWARILDHGEARIPGVHTTRATIAQAMLKRKGYVSDFRLRDIPTKSQDQPDTNRSRP